MVETQIEGNKNINISIPVGKYIRLKEIVAGNDLSVAKLAKKGIDLVLKEYEKESNSKNHKT